MKPKKNIQKGFTLIELLVAIGIFGLVVTMAAGIFVITITSQRRIIALRNVEDNIRFVTESMAREMRTGVNFSGGGNNIYFTNANGQSVAYRLSGGAIEKSVDGGSSYFAVTGSDITVNYLNFYLFGQASGDGFQPRVAIVMGASSQVGNQTANLKTQTMVSGRFLQI